MVEGYKKVSEICGPFRDTIFAYGNYGLTEKLKLYAKMSRGHRRAKRAYKLMRQYRGELTVPFMIRLGSF